ncbi:hypothetical protein EK21DRAFT_49513, partial [Setomelanomma holmii]
MVYNWDDKEAECYRLYVEEKRNLHEVITYWEARGFTPSKRAFQTQFKRWDFPSKQNPAHKNPVLVGRLHELWEQNYTQKDMVDQLQTEGFSINDRELIRLRLRLKLLLRESVPRPRRTRDVEGEQMTTKKKRNKTATGKSLINQLGNAILADQSSGDESQEEYADQIPDGEESIISSQDAVSQLQNEVDKQPLSAEDELRRQIRQEQLRKESDEKWRTRKRRRRTRGWAGLPADAPGEPPRFPSETTIDEAKAYLSLDNNMYRELRERFLQICKEHDIIKKTIAGPEKWAEIVRQLIDESEHLSIAFQTEPDVMQNVDALFRPKGQKALSIDVICMDVTKRLRTMESRMSLADAKNILALNPEQTRQVRNAFTEKLKADNFTNKHEAGEHHWADLKTAWVNESELLIRALAQGEADPEYNQKLRAVEILARDIMKRWQQEKIAKDPNKKKKVHRGPGPGPAPPVVPPNPLSARSRSHQQETRTETQTATQTTYDSIAALASAADLQIDPSLLLAASDAAILPTPSYHPEQQYTYQDQQLAPSYRPAQSNYMAQASTYYQTPSSTNSSSTPLPIYFRLHPHSTTSLPSKTVWLSILHQPSLEEIRQLAAREHPGTVVLKLEGLITYRGDHGDREVTVEVGDDEELGAYLGHVQAAGGRQGQGKATFVVLLGGAGAGC